MVEPFARIVFAENIPIFALVEEKFVEEAVVENKFVEVALVVVALPIVTPLINVVDAAVQMFCEARLRSAESEDPRDAGEFEMVRVLLGVVRPIVEF